MYKYILVSLWLIGCASSDRNPSKPIQYTDDLPVQYTNYEVICPLTATETVRDTLTVRRGATVYYSKYSLNFKYDLVIIKQYPQTCIAKVI